MAYRIALLPVTNLQWSWRLLPYPGRSTYHF